MTELKNCLERVTDQGNLETRLSEAQLEASLIYKQIENELASLGLWQGNLEAFEQLAVPTNESMRKFARQLRIQPESYLLWKKRSSVFPKIFKGNY